MCSVFIDVQKKEKKKVSWSDKFGKCSKENMETLLIARLLHAFTLLGCIVNFQHVTSSQTFSDCGICVHGALGGT